MLRQTPEWSKQEFNQGSSKGEKCTKIEATEQIRLCEKPVKVDIRSRETTSKEITRLSSTKLIQFVLSQLSVQPMPL